MRKKKKAFPVLLAAVLLSIVLAAGQTVAAYDAVTITFSNIGSSGTSLPSLTLSASYTGLVVDGVAMVALTDLASCMGADVSYSSNIWFLDRGMQTTMFTEGSTTMWTSNIYEVYDPVNGLYDEYEQTWSTDMPAAAQTIDDCKYVPLQMAARQLGALLAEPYSSTWRVYDFRINYTSPLSDDNEYIVGGDWLSSWSSHADDHLADHFHIDEFWSSSSYSYARQLKIAVSSLESAERVRHYFRNDQSLVLSSAFRSWAYNVALGGWRYSFHMRGRAWDAALDSLYTSAYDEFCNGESTPIDVAGYNFWRSRVPTTSNSRGYEIEKMPTGGDTWLHLQRQPGVDDAAQRP